MWTTQLPETAQPRGLTWTAQRPETAQPSGRTGAARPEDRGPAIRGGRKSLMQVKGLGAAVVLLPALSIAKARRGRRACQPACGQFPCGDRHVAPGEGRDYEGEFEADRALPGTVGLSGIRFFR